MGALAGAAAPMAAAQDEAAGVGVDTIVVTARNREESLQDVPLAISAFTAEDLDVRNIDSLDDLARFTPGLSFEDYSTGLPTPVIRGQAQTRLTALEPNVSTFFDGIYVPRGWAIDVGVSNIERIEVVKGPQSARYGRNAFAGAINYIPITARNHGDAPQAEAEGTIGADDLYEGGGHFLAPLGEKAAVSGGFFYSTYDGSWENNHPFADLDLDPGTSGNIGGWEKYAYSGSIHLNPIEQLGVEVSYYGFDSEQEGVAFQQLIEAEGALNCGAQGRLIPGLFPLLCGEVPEPPDVATTDPRAYGAQTDTGILRAEVNYELSDAFNFNYLFGWVEGDVDIGSSAEPDTVDCVGFFDLPGLPLCNFQNTPIGDIDYKTHEARLAFDNGGPLSGAVGGFYSTGEDNTKFFSINIPAITDPDNIPLFDAPDGLVIPLADATTETDVVSLFGEAQWALSDATRLGAEFRWSQTDLTAINNISGLILSETYDAITPRFTVEHDLSADTLLFGSIARGSKAGGFNETAVLEEDRTFDEETNWTYEIGAKNTLLDGRLRLNGAVYYTDWNDVQINAPDSGATTPNAVNITLNLGSATVVGVEFDTLFQLTDNLSVDGSFSYADATYDDGTRDSRFSRIVAPCDDVVCSSTGDIGGNDIERTPKTQLSVGGQWEAPLPNWNGDYFIRGDYSWQSEFFVT
ncbi:MAG: TonB-dependent receptor, partial [Caulobacterales bacterium]|nr:TonB-dependent receptor [Caulobacterales bacterium]